jgi:hypothetical protein
MEDLDFGSLYENYEKEQAYLSAEREHMMYLTEYVNEVVRYDNTGDNLPVYMFVFDFNQIDDELYCVVIRSHCPEYYPGEKVTVKPSYTVIIKDFDIVEHKKDTEILF